MQTNTPNYIVHYFVIFCSQSKMDSAMVKSDQLEEIHDDSVNTGQNNEVKEMKILTIFPTEFFKITDYSTKIQKSLS